MVEQSLIEYEKSNFVTISLDSMYSIPESWTTNKEYAYSIAMPVPLNDEVRRIRHDATKSRNIRLMYLF